ncbi:MAG: Hint domain-containing protein [Pseudoruegeria sp.]
MPQFLVWSVADFGAGSLANLLDGTFTVTGTPNIAQLSDDDNSFDDFFGNGGQTQDPGLNQNLTTDLIIDSVTVGSIGDEIYNAAEGVITNQSTGETGRIIYITINGGSVNEFVGVATTIDVSPGDTVTTSSLTPLAEESYDNIVACFTAGTMIRTLQGEISIDELSVGDFVLTKDHGPQQIRWIGRRFVSGGRLETNENLQPIQIKKFAFGEGLPSQDLLLSPNHRVLLDQPSLELLFGETEVLVSSKNLMSHPDVNRVCPEDGIEYIHLMFDHHEIVTSHGLETESFHPQVLAQYKGDDAVRDELFALFPELRDNATAYGPTARMTLKGYESTLIRSDWTVHDPKTNKTFVDPEWAPYQRIA